MKIMAENREERRKWNEARNRKVELYDNLLKVQLWIGVVGSDVIWSYFKTVLMENILAYVRHFLNGRYFFNKENQLPTSNITITIIIASPKSRFDHFRRQLIEILKKIAENHNKTNASMLVDRAAFITFR